MALFIRSDTMKFRGIESPTMFSFVDPQTIVQLIGLLLIPQELI